MLQTIPERIDRAWAAGFFDGEGCSSIHRCRHKTKSNKEGEYVYLRPRLSLSQVQDGKAILEKFRDSIGGHGQISLIKQSKQSPNFQDIWMWRVNGFAPIQMTMCALWPYLGKTKKEQFAHVMKVTTADVRNRPKRPRGPLGRRAAYKGVN